MNKVPLLVTIALAIFVACVGGFAQHMRDVSSDEIPPGYSIPIYENTPCMNIQVRPQGNGIILIKTNVCTDVDKQSKIWKSKDDNSEKMSLR